jgi:hypothetical protein
MRAGASAVKAGATALDETEPSAPVLTLHLLQRERACPPEDVCNLPSQTTWAPLVF